jgi:hypothetical protein
MDRCTNAGIVSDGLKFVEKEERTDRLHTEYRPKDRGLLLHLLSYSLSPIIDYIDVFSIVACLVRFMHSNPL